MATSSPADVLANVHTGPENGLRRASKELRNFIAESFRLFPHRVVYIPGRQRVKSMRGSMKLPPSYRRCPMLAIDFAKFRLRKYPYGVLHDDIKWPEPYVVYNTMVKRMQAHKYLRNDPNRDEFIQKLMIPISHGVVVPEGCENVVLERPSRERKECSRRTFNLLNADTVDKDLEQFFSNLLSPPNTNFWGNQDVAIELISLYITYSDPVQYSFACQIREAWYMDYIAEQKKQRGDVASSHQTEIIDDVHFWRTLKRLRSKWNMEDEEKSEANALAAYLRASTDFEDEFVKAHKRARSELYSMVRRWLPITEKIKIYKTGISPEIDGWVKVGVNFLDHPEITAASVSLKVFANAAEPDKIDTTRVKFSCRYKADRGRERSSSGRGTVSVKNEEENSSGTDSVKNE